MRARRNLIAMAAITGLAFGGQTVAWPAAAEQITIATTYIVEHPALDAVRNGLRDELAKLGYEEGKNLKTIHESAQGNPATAAQIARKFLGEKPDLIVPITTPSTQAMVAAVKDIPVVFSAVADPLGAKIVTDLQHPGGNVTGVTDLSPIGLHLDLIKEITPGAKKIGVPFNPGEANAVTLVRLLNELAPGKGLQIVEAPAPRSADVMTAARSLVGKVDVIYVPADNTIVSALEAVLKVGQENRLPVYAGDTDSVPRGAIAALGFNYYDVGRQTAHVVERVLKGEKPGSIPVSGIAITELYVNPGAARTMGIELPRAVVERAHTVVK